MTLVADWDDDGCEAIDDGSEAPGWEVAAAEGIG